MSWLIGAAVVLAGATLFHLSRRAKSFGYRGRRYRRDGDGGFSYADGGPIADPQERAEVEAYWDSTHSSSSNGDGDGGGDGGGGGGD
jgi:hypothetical protein